MSLGLAVLSVAIIGLAMAGKYLLGGAIAKVPGNEVQDEKDENKRLLLKGLGVMGLVILGAVALFTLLGIPGFSAIVKSGAITMLLMGAALLVMGQSVKKLVDLSKELGVSPIEAAEQYREIVGLAKPGTDAYLAARRALRRMDDK